MKVVILLLRVDKTNYAEFFYESGYELSWEERDFVDKVRKYMASGIRKVMLVSGLRGTGKTVGVLQAMKDFNAVYYSVQAGEDVYADEVMSLLKSTLEDIIVIDEYTWIKTGTGFELNGYLSTLVNNGKRIIITGTESLCLEALKAGDLIHRTQTVHTTHIAFPEYCRLFHRHATQQVCDEFLKNGSIFEGYLQNNQQSMQIYIENAIIQNLKAYAGRYTCLFDSANTSNIIYALLYNAIWDLLKDEAKLFTGSNMEMFERFGIEVEDDLRPKVYVPVRDTNIVAEMLCSVGVLVRVPNLKNRIYEYDPDYVDEYKVYIANPSLTYQFAKLLFPDYPNEKTLLGRIYEASCMVDMYFKKSPGDNIYYFESKGADNCEIDLVIVRDDDTLKKTFYLLECKHAAVVNVHAEKAGNWSILNGKIDKLLYSVWGDSEIGGKYIIHPGECSYQSRNDTEVLIVNQDEYLYNYFHYEENKNRIAAKETQGIHSFNP